MDRNGYNEQIVPSDGRCQYCGKTNLPLQRHEVFHGPNRAKSKEFGCWVLLCFKCHMKLHHEEASIDRELKVWMQQNAMAHYGWTIEQFREVFGKNYLEEFNVRIET